MVKPLISVIIPCYNSGRYLLQALDSVAMYHDKAVYEIIIIDDGSTEEDTITLLNQLKNTYHIIHQINKGPAAARNAGVSVAKGHYLLMLDSDNKIDPAYIDEGIAILDAHPAVDIVHANPVFFGDTDTPRFITGPFNMELMLRQNYIDNCVVMRKTCWQSLGGQDENRAIMSHEDWDFWLRAAKAGYGFYYIDKPLYHYRVLNNSLVNDFMLPGGNQGIYSYIYGKHSTLVAQYYNKLLNEVSYSRLDRKRPFRSLIKFIRNRYFKNGSDV